MSSRCALTADEIRAILAALREQRFDHKAFARGVDKLAARLKRLERVEK